MVDTVSRAGEHKCVALWRYGKGEANGAPRRNSRQPPQQQTNPAAAPTTLQPRDRTHTGFETLEGMVPGRPPRREPRRLGAPFVNFYDELRPCAGEGEERLVRYALAGI